MFETAHLIEALEFLSVIEGFGQSFRKTVIQFIKSCEARGGAVHELISPKRRPE